MTSDSIGRATEDPLVVEDIHVGSNGFPEQWCPVLSQYGEQMSTDAMGITSICETQPGEGIVFFLKNNRPGGVNRLVGAGIAKVTVHNHVPRADRLAEYWWDGSKEPHYGDVTALRAGEWIYGYGHAENAQHVFVTRVHYTQATELGAYEYWNGSDWQKERMTNVGEKEGMFWQTQQGQMIWSEYYSCFMFVYTSKSRAGPPLNLNMALCSWSSEWLIGLIEA